MNDRFEFWRKCLLWANIMTIGVGLVVAFAGNSLVLSPHNHATQELFFNGTPMDVNVLKFKNWLFGIIGGTIVGFHVLMVFIINHSFKNREVWAYRAMWWGLLSWFVIDSGISFYYKAYHNIYLINLVALVLI
jgi:hypothetical protein